MRPLLDAFGKRIVHAGPIGAGHALKAVNNALLAIVSLVALAALVLFRHHFEAHHPIGQFALGLLFGGIMGNLVDRLHPDRLHVIDFLYFYVNKRGGGEAGFPAFNVADSGICVGVFWYILWSLRQPPETGNPKSQISNAK